MNLIEKACIIKFHKSRISKYPEFAPEALGWKNKESQMKRFEVLTQIGNFNGCSVLDLGCGYGDLKIILDTIYKNFEYLGIDCVGEYINAARAKFQGSPNTYFYQLDFAKLIFPEVDYILASGAMAYRTDNQIFYANLITQMFNAARKAIAFNMLDSNNFKSEGILVSHDPLDIKEFCMSITPKVKLVKDYLDDDFTIFMYKQ